MMMGIFVNETDLSDGLKRVKVCDGLPRRVVPRSFFPILLE